jgi:hypothetical protein
MIALKKQLNQAFHFLTVEYNLKRIALNQSASDRNWTPAVGFAGLRTAVLVHYDVRDAILDVHIFDLDREPSPIQFSRLSPVRGYALNVVIYVADPAQLVGAWGRPGSARGIEKDGTFDEYVADVARKLRLYADDLLRGDFSRASRLETALQRMREVASNTSRSQSTSALSDCTKKVRSGMKRLLAAPEFGMMVVEDTDSEEISFQCLCAQMGMWWRRIVLTDEEVTEWRNNSLDLHRLMVDICSESPRTAPRMVPAFDENDIVGFGGKN